MKKVIINPYTYVPGFTCFGCSPDNPNGLQMKFTEDGDYVISHWEPKPHFQGFNNMLHGGIQATLLDEIGFWLVTVKMKTSCVTSKLEIKYKKPVSTLKGNLLLKAIVTETKRNIISVKAELFDGDGELCSYATIEYFTFSEKIAKEKYFYPGAEAFYEDNNEI